MPSDDYERFRYNNRQKWMYRREDYTGGDSDINSGSWKRSSENIFNDLRREISDSPTRSISSDIIDASPIADRYDKGYFTKFKRLPILDPYNFYDGATEYLFFTRPDLCICPDGENLSESLKGNPIFEFAKKSYPEVLRDLQSSAVKNGICKFIPILSNASSSALDLPDIDSTDIETPQNIYGTKIYYRGTSAGSDKDYEFSIEFEDTKWSELYMFFKLWDEYKRLDWAGEIDLSNSDSAAWENYIAYKVLFDQIAIFKIIVASDGFTILFWAEIIGCYPKGVPRSVWSDPSNLNNYMKITTNWKGQFLRDMNPYSLAHFNKLSIGIPDTRSNILRSTGMPIYNTETMEMNRRWSSKPFIYHQSGLTGKDKTHPYKLGWLP